MEDADAGWNLPSSTTTTTKMRLRWAAIKSLSWPGRSDAWRRGLSTDDSALCSLGSKILDNVRKIRSPWRRRCVPGTVDKPPEGRERGLSSEKTREEEESEMILRRRMRGRRKRR